MLETALLQTLRIAGRVLPIIVTTLLIVEILTAFGVLKRLWFIVKPLAWVARLPNDCGLALLASVGSVLSADAMTAAFYREGRIKWPHVLLSVQANTIACYFRESLTYVVPVIMPALGFRPGLACLGAFVFTGTLKIALVIIVGRYIADSSRVRLEQSQISGPTGEEAETLVTPAKLRAAFLKAVRLSWRIGGLLVVTTFIMLLTVSAGALDKLNVVVAPLMSVLRLPELLLVPIFTYIASPTASASAIGALYRNGDISCQATALGALLGGMLSLFVSSIRYSLPRHIGIFGVRLGVANVVIGLAIGIVSRVILIFVIVMLT